MGVSLHTALVIQSNEVTTAAGGPDADGKFAGWILLGDRLRPLVNTTSIYDSEEEAVAAVDKVVADIRARTDLEFPWPKEE